MITLSVLSENTARGLGILGEHGLSFWLDTGTHRVLFDTGQGMALIPNARRLGIDLSRADAIVVSHGHYDHVGGLADALAAAPSAVLHLHPAATRPKFSGSGGPAPGRRISLPWLEAESFRTPQRTVIMSSIPREIVPGVWSTGEIPRTNDFEDTGGPFFLDEELTRPDPLLDEQSLYFATSSGLVMLCGCAHAGVINTIRHVAHLTHGAPLHLVLGGWHLENATPRRMDETVNALRRTPVPRIAFCHCTGAAASRRLWQEFPERCLPLHSGSVLSFSS
jgi:7,8-dihydropterin-6-yl-methyl-4-(beta-D-ribofuranosyl)aminobenzene 5'-phosphate synthase